MHFCRPRILFLILAALLFSSLPARAQLGGSSADVDAVAAFYAGKQTRSTQRQGYQVHHITSAELKILEFVSDQDGKVFAVAWEGRHTPDLGPLLGTYGDELARKMTQDHEARRQGQGRGAHSVQRGPSSALESANLTVRRTGRPGFSQGLVCLKNQLPAGLESCDALH